MKKLCSLIMLLVMAMFISGCGSVSTTKDGVPTQKEVVQKDMPKEKVYGLNEAASPEKGFSMTVTNCTVNQTKGNKAKDGSYSDGGDYIGIGSNVVKASDYKQVTYDITVSNETEKAINLSFAGWEAKIDGNAIPYPTLRGIIFEKVLPNANGKGSISLDIKNTLNPSDILLTYKYMDYGDEWNKAVADMMAKKMTLSEYDKKFKPIPITWKIVQ